MMQNNFHKYLINLGFSESEILSYLNENVFDYRPHPKLPSVKYIQVHSKKDIFEEHNHLWNLNSDNIFFAVESQKTHLINAKVKPDSNTPLKNSICIESFDYGFNSKGFENINIEKISKDYISSTYFYQFVQERQKKKQEVDKDLLLNLIALRNDLIDNKNEHVIHLLILRCLFVKYLEDRKIFEVDFLSGALSSKTPKKLIETFNEVCKINGDVFGNSNLSENDIKKEYLEKLYRFFTTDYQSGQGTLFPYRFDYIPIQLISHVYEAFLKNETKKGKGVYYTPSFVVDFMISQGLKQKAKENPEITVLDPAVGSGAFLVESFKIIRDSHSRKLNYSEKKQILETQLWGIDIDSDALQITAFSLYLALLEDESPEFVKNEIKHAHPILPSLIGKTLQNANAIVDSVFSNQKFDCIISNPPWGSVSSEINHENIAEREAIDNKNNAYPEYEHISDYERSQAFLKRVSKWQKEDTLITMIVKNSIFLNDKAKDFRRDFLINNRILTFFELSHYNKILFKKKIIGKIYGKQPIEIGASEPSAIIIFNPNLNQNDYSLNYISPKLTKIGEHFELIHYTSNDSFKIKKQEFIDNDNLWRILVNSDFEGYELIEKKIFPQKELKVEARTGFQPKMNMVQLGEPVWKVKIEPKDFEAFCQRNQSLDKFNWNQKLRRKPSEEIFNNSRIIVPVRPLKEDQLLFRAIHLDKEIVYSDNIISIKLIDDNLKYLNNYPYLAIFNSQLISFYFYQISSQWGKGDEKRAKLRNIDIEALPIKKLKNKDILKRLQTGVTKVSELKENRRNVNSIVNEINDLVFDFYDLTDYEKEIIKEFYQIHVCRVEGGLQFVQQKDVQEYFNAFKETFSLILSPDHTIKATYNISINVGAIIKISIVEKDNKTELQVDDTLHVLHFVKNKQLTETDKLLREEKIKIYELHNFYIIKSNQFKDWTKRQAIKDAKEEIETFVNHLANKR